MKKRTDLMREQSDRTFSELKAANQQFGQIADEMYRTGDVNYHAGQIISKIDREFKEATRLNESDIAFLFFATGLQCVRWILLPSLDSGFKQTPSEKRISATDGGKIEYAGQRDYLKKNKDTLVKESDKYFTWEEIIRAPVPYDAMNGTSDIVIPGVTGNGKNISGTNHHSATYGHDPVVGWIIGPINIISRTITFTDAYLSTRCVELTSPLEFKRFGLAHTGQIVTEPKPLIAATAESLDSTQEDNRRLFAAVAKQGMHQASDKYTKFGLQIPFISPAKAQALLTEGWNSVEAEKLLKLAGKNAAIQAGISILINLMIRALHLLCYDENRDGPLNLYEVRTRKILSYSNLIASSTNVGYAVASGDVRKLDIGGILVPIYRLISDYHFIQKIKKEFLENRWYDIVMNEEF